MNKFKLLSLLAWAVATSVVLAQPNSTNSRYSSGSSGVGDLKSSIVIEPFLGATVSFAYGDYIDYQRSFLNVSEEGTDFKGGIQPLIFGTAGVQARIMPFQDDLLNKLGFSLGLQYVQKGFSSKFKMNYSAQSDYTDVMQYTEIYRHNYLTVPVQIRYGTKWFGTIGLSFTRHLNSTRAQKLKHEQSGTGALNGGFDTSGDNKKKVANTLLDQSSTDFILGGGHQFNSKWSTALRANFGGKVFKNVTDNYKTILLELSLFKAI